MANREDLIAIAREDLGYTEAGDPLTGTKYGRWYAKGHGSYFAQAGVPWCAMAVSYWANRANVESVGLPNASCSYIMRDAIRAGAWKGRHDLERGDVILFDWGGDGDPDHVGIVLARHSYGYTTIEGNTQKTVMERSRAFAYVLGGLTPHYEKAYLAIDGIWGPLTTRALQRTFGTPEDGIVSGQSAWTCSQPSIVAGGSFKRGTGGSLLVRAMQRWLGVECDGSLGPESIKALQRRMDTPEDGTLSRQSLCVMEMQDKLNAGTLI